MTTGVNIICVGPVMPMAPVPQEAAAAPATSPTPIHPTKSPIRLQLALLMPYIESHISLMTAHVKGHYKNEQKQEINMLH